MSKIEWTGSTWNPVTGCDKVSLGCKNCYAEVMAKRLKNMRQPRYRNGFKVTLQHDILDRPLGWKKPRKVFVNSMSDLFHKDVPLEYIQRVFDVMGQCPQHTFQVLTKRSERLRELASLLTWHPNVWMGVSVENRKAARRIDDLCEVPAAVRFLSVEPLLEQVDLGLRSWAWTPWGAKPERVNDLSYVQRLDWVIVGGESGHKARPLHPDWVSLIQEDCEEAGIPFFFKQWGAWSPVCDVDADDVSWNENLMNPARRTIALEPNGCVPVEIHQSIYRHDYQPAPGSWWMQRVGKKKAGAFLFGREYREFPEV